MHSYLEVWSHGIIVGRRMDLQVPKTNRVKYTIRSSFFPRAFLLRSSVSDKIR